MSNSEHAHHQARKVKLHNMASKLGVTGSLEVCCLSPNIQLCRSVLDCSLHSDKHQHVELKKNTFPRSPDCRQMKKSRYHRNHCRKSRSQQQWRSASGSCRR